MKAHQKRKHALLSASGASRWLNCTPSARLEEQFPLKGSSIYADEGTLAHEFAELELRFVVGEISKRKYTTNINKLRKYELYSDEMEGFVEIYVNYVLEIYNRANNVMPSAMLKIEERVNLTDYIPEGFGTNDAIIITDNTMYVNDLKYGKGVRVDAQENSQLMLYALGSLAYYSVMYDIERVEMAIIQPRLDHISVYEITADELIGWGIGEVKPKAELANKGEGELVPGDHCRWCAAKPACRAFNEFNLDVAKHEFADPKTLPIKELVEVFKKIDTIQDWAKSVKEYLTDQAKQGKKVPGHKIVEGRANRRWQDEAEAIKVLTKQGYKPTEISNSKIKGIGDIEKLVGKAEFTKLLGEFVVKPQGAPTLVPDTDKRPAIGIDQAKEDFK